MRAKRILFSLVIGLSMATNGQVTSFNFDNDTQKDWSFSFTPYALLAAQSTDVGEESIRQSFDDLASLTNAGFQFVASLRYQRYSLSVDGTFATLGVNERQGPASIDLEVKQSIMDVSAGYVIFSTFIDNTDNIAKGWSIEGTLGAKNWVNDLTIDFKIELEQLENDFIIRTNENQSWWDLMLGVRTNVSLSDKVFLGARLSVGGFGIGNSSDFSYDFVYLNVFKVLNYMTINAGFRNFNYQRTDDGVDTSVNVIGPLLGLSFFI
ncbi:hypothetical protein J4050_11785 [Winogradskyella sp. DF17]|uniref:Outer membrane protein beta-barrel domain-containing protein n=1 Tax=Winogradskyella pelagia TaxID=2819984 RepID=A0ABS3T3W6_9FLAO|nr:hypothetical protein [Winogradskyella sp. DF17]MBO3117433.1 hypothetical protein [Winogradskyella sp. DF17]